MANRFTGRIDRFAQMSKQEELIARKRQEILDKQRTAQLAKAVQALQAKQKVTDYREEQDTITNASGEEIIDNHKEKDENKNTSADELSIEINTAAVASQTKKSSLCSRTGKIPVAVKRTQTQASVVEQPAPKIMNSFCNDGSFLENFKKILEKADQPKPLLLPENLAKMTGIPVEEKLTTNTTESVVENPNDEQTQEESQQQQQQQPDVLDSIAFNPMCFLNQHHPHQQLQHPLHMMQHLPMTLTQPPPPPPPATSHDATSHDTNFYPTITTSTTTTTAMNVSTAPPPVHVSFELAQYTSPPPPLYMIPPPEPLQVNTIPAPKAFNLNAIPKPQINLDAIQIPQITIEQDHQYQPQSELQQQHQQKQQLQQEQLQQQQQQQHVENAQVLSDNNDCEQNPLSDLPSSVEMLIASVAVNGDEYEDKLCHMHKSNIHPTMWFIFNKNSQQYCAYRQRVNELRQKQLQGQLQREQENQSSQQLKVSTCDSEKYDPETAISADVDSDDEYMRGMMNRNRDNLKRRIECRNELSEEERQENAAQEAEAQQRREERKRLRKSRWGEKVEDDEASSSSVIATVQTSFANQNKPLLKAITRTDPALLNYARNNYGTTDLSEEDWKKCEEHFKVNILYQDMIAKRQEIDRLARSGKFKFEYDSDEDVEGGTWEHKLRCAEMDATQLWASALTKQSEGKHHIGDFLPPEELKKFMEQYESKKNNRMPDLSDYKEYKLKEDNIGFQMLQKLGWKEGQGLGQDGAGIVDPVNKCAQREGNHGLGVGSAATPESNDNEYDAYRKRMMLAYRFRPNPMNNPRRAYY